MCDADDNANYCKWPHLPCKVQEMEGCYQGIERWENITKLLGNLVLTVYDIRTKMLKKPDDIRVF